MAIEQTPDGAGRHTQTMALPNMVGQFGERHVAVLVLGYLRQLEDAAGQIAGFGVRLWPILQDLGQLKALYRDRWQIFIGNSQFVQAFGNNDLETLKWISERLGQTTVVVEEIAKTTHDQRQRGATGESLRVQVQRPLIPLRMSVTPLAT